MILEEEAGRLLHEFDLGTYADDGSGDIKLLYLPDEPDEAIAVSRYPGGESDSKLGHDSVNLQFRVRGARNDVRTGAVRAQAIYDALHGLGNRTLPGGTWLQLAVGNQSGPAPIGRDQNGRHEWAVNFRFELRRVTTNRV